MNISLPDTMRSFVEEQVSARGYGTSSEYVRELIRRDQDRQHLHPRPRWTPVTLKACANALVSKASQAGSREGKAGCPAHSS